MFAVHCRDKSDAAPLRAAHRPEHLAYVKGSGAVIVGAGPLINAEGHAEGGLFLLNVADAAAAQSWADGDPFAQLGVYETVNVHEWRYAFGSGLSAAA